MDVFDIQRQTYGQTDRWRETWLFIKWSIV